MVGSGGWLQVKAHSSPHTTHRCQHLWSFSFTAIVVLHAFTTISRGKRARVAQHQQGCLPWCSGEASSSYASQVRKISGRVNPGRFTDVLVHDTSRPRGIYIISPPPPPLTHIHHCQHTHTYTHTHTHTHKHIYYIMHTHTNITFRIPPQATAMSSQSSRLKRQRIIAT